MEKKNMHKVLVANRGEIAIRVFRACNDLSLRTVAIYSKEDISNLFRTKADEAYLIGENKSPLGAYLDIDAIIHIAKAKKVDAIHPGYGFLSENADFARACEENGIVFIGPPARVLARMGDKLNAKELAISCGIPTIPGSEEPLRDAADALKRAAEYGYPIILKAAAGGGGRGMRRVNGPAELEDAFRLVQSEAGKAFGNDAIFMEKYLEEPKHIEVQILADAYGNVVHLFERDCSLQRRYQKVVEFTPAVSLPQSIRDALCRDAVRLAQAAKYVNAGTVEFLVDKQGEHYFIEMNPRIQVEHTVTEMVTGIDLVQAQIRVAQGFRLSDPELGIGSQADVELRGCAIQCRITTEDPRNNFSPDTGKVAVYRSAGGFGVRLDAGNAYAGAEISPYYDSLLVKVTTYDRTFDGAARKALRTINEMRIRGVKTNVQFLNNILTHPVFLSADCNTSFIDDTPSLFEFEDSRDRATKILKYIGGIVVNEKQGPKPVFDAPAIPAVSGAPKPGLKQLLDEQGPEAVRDFVLAEKKLLITDTTFRDAHQSLLATRVRTRDMAEIAPYTAHALAEAFSIEMWGGATFDVAYRFLHESPWERLDILREKIPNLLFQMLLRGANAVGYSNYPDNLIRAFIQEAAKSGIDVFRIFDSLNWIPGMEIAIDEVLKQGKLAEASICYTGDILDPRRDKYTLQYYVSLAKELEKRGAHLIAIKDMSGLLKPYAAKKLVAALKNEVGLPIHLHTHDTSGNQVAALLLASEAGADIVDTAISSMSSLTSQPSMNAVVTALAGQERDTGLSDQALMPLASYWAQVRKFYAPFEAGLISPATDIYRYEIPGGQYTNLRPQVESLGLGHRFDEVREKYKEVNDMLGDLVKVTPSSKMVGDLAIFMVQNDLTAETLVERGKNLPFPDSVVSYFEGMMGQPAWGFPEDIQAVVLKGKAPITCRPGDLLPPVDFKEMEAAVCAFLPNPGLRDVVSYCLYPKVVEEYYAHGNEYADLTYMDSHVFFQGLNNGESTKVTIEDGKTLLIKYISQGDRNEDGTRNVVFELNGARREVTVSDKSGPAAVAGAAMADPDDPMQIGASIPGMVSAIQVKTGETVKENQVIAIIEAMKMETSVVAKADGVIDKIHVSENEAVKAGQLLIALK